MGGLESLDPIDPVTDGRPQGDAEEALGQTIGRHQAQILRVNPKQEQAEAKRPESVTPGGQGPSVSHVINYNQLQASIRVT